MSLLGFAAYMVWTSSGTGGLGFGTAAMISFCASLGPWGGVEIPEEAISIGQVEDAVSTLVCLILLTNGLLVMDAPDAEGR